METTGIVPPAGLPLIHPIPPRFFAFLRFFGGTGIDGGGFRLDVSRRNPYPSHSPL